MVFSLSGDILGLADLIVGLTFDITSKFLFVDDPTIVLTMMSMTFLLLGVSVSGEATIESAFDAFNFVFSQLIPN